MSDGGFLSVIKAETKELYFETAKHEGGTVTRERKRGGGGEGKRRRSEVNYSRTESRGHIKTKTGRRGARGGAGAERERDSLIRDI